MRRAGIAGERFGVGSGSVGGEERGLICEYGGGGAGVGRGKNRGKRGECTNDRDMLQGISFCRGVRIDKRAATGSISALPPAIPAILPTILRGTFAAQTPNTQHQTPNTHKRECPRFGNRYDAADRVKRTGGRGAGKG